MSDFKFNPLLTSQENVELFFTHLESIDSEMVILLKNNLEKIFPLPNNPSERSSARINFNQEISRQFDSNEENAEVNEE